MPKQVRGSCHNCHLCRLNLFWILTHSLVPRCGRNDSTSWPKSPKIIHTIIRFYFIHKINFVQKDLDKKIFTHSVHVLFGYDVYVLYELTQTEHEVATRRRKLNTIFPVVSEGTMFTKIYWQLWSEKDCCALESWIIQMTGTQERILKDGMIIVLLLRKIS